MSSSPEPTSPTASDSPPPDTPASAAGEPATLADIVHSLGRRFVDTPQSRFFTGAYTPGEVAELRRLDYRQGFASAGPAFWRVVTEELEPHRLLSEWADEEALRRWMVILQGLATLRELNASKPSLGVALARANISEARVTRLLTGRGDALLSQVRPLAHQLRSKGQTVNWVPVANLVLSETQPYAEKIRQLVARDFYRQQSSSADEASG